MWNIAKSEWREKEMARTLAYILVVFVAFFLNGCAGNEQANRETDYEQTKKMVVDILQTDEGKKVLHELIVQDDMKEHLVIESDVVKQAISDTLASEKSTTMWQKLFEDPEFVTVFMESIAEEQAKFLTLLMNDAAFQKKVLEIMQNPEISQQTLAVLKGQQFREHLEKTIEETLQTPTFQAKIQQLLLEAAEKQSKKEEEESDKQKDDEKEQDSGEGESS